MDWSNARASVTDYLSLDRIADGVYEQVGWSDTEVTLLYNWYTMDAGYSTQAFETVAGLADDGTRTSAGAAVLDLRTRSPLTVLSYILLLFQGIVCLMYLRWFQKGKAWRAALTLVTAGALCFAMFSILALQGRLPERAAQVPVLPAAVMVFCLFPECLPLKGTLVGWRRKALPVTLALLLVGTLAVAVPTAYSLRKVPSKWNYNAFDDMDAQALSHPEQLWIYDNDLINDPRMFPDVSAGTPTNLMFWGGWQTNSPEYLARLAAFGLDAETFGAADWLNPAVRFLSLEKEPNGTLLTYLCEQTGLDVRYEREQLSAGLYGYRFFIAP